MSLHPIALEDGRRALVGWDPSTASFYAQVWEGSVDVAGAPSWAAGYPPEQRQVPLAGGREFGPYPIEDSDELAHLLRRHAGVELFPRMQTQLTCDKVLAR